MSRSFKTIPCAAAVFVLLAGPAWADGYSGLVGADYSTATGGVNGGGVEARALGQYGVLNAQIDLGYQNGGVNGTGGNIWQGGGDVFLRNASGTLGASISRSDFHAQGLSQALTSYGGFAEWYASSNATLQIKAGGFNGGISGVYGAAGAVFYLPRHFSLDLNYDYTQIDSAGHATSAGGGVTYFLSQKFPAAIEVQYNHVLETGGGDAVMLELSYRFGGTGTSLESWDRAGPARWTAGLNL
jgi:hypothetical protein